MKAICLLAVVIGCGGTEAPRDCDVDKDAPRNECEEMAVRGCDAIWDCDGPPMLCRDTEIGEICENLRPNDCVDRVAGLVNCYEYEVAKTNAEEVGGTLTFICGFIADDLAACLDVVVVPDYCQYGH